MSEETTGGEYGNNHELKPVAESSLVNAIKAGEALLTKEHLIEIKGRRAVADLDTLIAACESFLSLIEKYVPEEFLGDLNLGWGHTDEPAEGEEA